MGYSPAVIRLLLPILLILLMVLAAGCSRIIPTHNIPAHPDYIHAGVQAGDTIAVTTKDGKSRIVEVTDVGVDWIESIDGTIHFSDIQAIEIQSWSAPQHPCGAGVPVGCSIPEVVRVLSGDYNQQTDKFHPACVIHDFCYRHGFATYGVNREQCDADFYESMKKACSGKGGIGIFDIKENSICRISASQTYEAVRRHGEPHFRTSNSTVCEYRLGL